MADWYYIEEGKSVGPVSTEEIIGRIRKAKDQPLFAGGPPAARFPINRENTGNILENRPWDGKSCRRFFPRNQVVGQLIPCSAKQGILSRRSGKIRGRSGKRAGVSAN